MLKSVILTIYAIRISRFQAVGIKIPVSQNSMSVRTDFFVSTHVTSWELGFVGAW